MFSVCIFYQHHHHYTAHCLLHPKCKGSIPVVGQYFWDTSSWGLFKWFIFNGLDLGFEVDIDVGVFVFLDVGVDIDEFLDVEVFLDGSDYNKQKRKILKNLIQFQISTPYLDQFQIQQFNTMFLQWQLRFTFLKLQITIPEI